MHWAAYLFWTVYLESSVRLNVWFELVVRILIPRSDSDLLNQLTKTDSFSGSFRRLSDECIKEL